MGVRKSLIRLLLGRERAAALNARRMAGLPDRRAMTEDYLPAFAGLGGRILWVGCRDYTRDYPARLEAKGAEVWTTDIDPGCAVWGRAGRHRTGDLLKADALFAELAFDAVLCNGVLGWGVDAPADQTRALEAMARLLRPGGRLLLGWNTDKIEDPLALSAPWFTPLSLDGIEPRRTFAGSTHVYDLLSRSTSPPPGRPTDDPAT
jgi:SAM-dependent methyltransferase